MRRRLRLLPFTNTPPKSDVRLKEKLEAEYPQILQWMLNGLVVYLQQGLKAPQVIRDASTQYLSDEDKFLQFWEGRFEKDNNEVLKVADVVRVYVGWCTGNRVQPLASSSKSMSPLLTSRGFTVLKRSAGLVVVGWKRANGPN